MDWHDRITVDPKVLVGKPVIKGTRIAVEFVLELLGRGWTVEQVLQEYDHLMPEDIQACLSYASDVLKSERVYATPRRTPPRRGEKALRAQSAARDMSIHVVPWPMPSLALRARMLQASRPRVRQRKTDVFGRWCSARSLLFSYFLASACQSARSSEGHTAPSPAP